MSQLQLTTRSCHGPSQTDLSQVAKPFGGIEGLYTYACDNARRLALVNYLSGDCIDLGPPSLAVHGIKGCVNAHLKTRKPDMIL